VHTNSTPPAAHQLPPRDERLLLPVLARVLDLGHGPPALVSWVRDRLRVWNAPGGDPEPARGAPVLLRLARELVRLLPPGGIGGIGSEDLRQTLCGLRPQTICETPGGTR
jgi:hypothetical protein